MQLLYISKTQTPVIVYIKIMNVFRAEIHSNRSPVTGHIIISGAGLHKHGSPVIGQIISGAGLHTHGSPVIGQIISGAGLHTHGSPVIGQIISGAGLHTHGSPVIGQIISGAGLPTHRSPVIGHIIISWAWHRCILLGHSGRTLPVLHTHTTVNTT